MEPLFVKFRPAIRATPFWPFILCLLFPLSLTAQDEVLVKGSLVKKSKAVAGDFSIIRKGERLMLVLGENFKAKPGPDLKIVFSPLPLEKVTGKNAIQEKSLVIGLLKSNQGGQSFMLPEEFDLSKYKTVLVHCEKYAVLWGGGPLR